MSRTGPGGLALRKHEVLHGDGVLVLPGRVADARPGRVVPGQRNGVGRLDREARVGLRHQVAAVDHLLVEDDPAVVDAVDPVAFELLAVELVSRRVDQMIAHGRRDHPQVLEVRRQVVSRHGLARQRELVAANDFGAAGSPLESEDVLNRLDIEMNVEVRLVEHARRDVPVGVPVEQSPLERDIRPTAGLARNGKDALVPGRAFGGEVDHAVVVGVETTMPVGGRRRQGVQGAGRKDHADCLRGAGLVELGIARDGAVAEVGRRAEDTRGPWCGIAEANGRENCRDGEDDLWVFILPS